MPGFDAAARRAALLRSPFFQAMRPPELEAVLARSLLREVARGDTVMRKGEPGAGLLVILRGGLRVASTTAEGAEVTLGLLGPGEILGEISLLDGLDRSADVIAVDPSVLLVVDRRDFQGLLAGSADLCLRLMRVLCARLRLANLTIEDVALLDLPGRLAKVLLRLARDFGVPAQPAGAPPGARPGTHPGAQPGTRQAVRIALRLSQKDLGTLAGGSREKVNRQLRAWEDAAVLGKQGGHIVVLRPCALAELAPDGDG